MNSVVRIVRRARPRPRAAMCVALLLAVVAGLPAESNAQGRAVRWSIVPSPNEEGYNWLVDVDASAGNNAWSVGYYLENGVYETLAERWDGSAWTLVDTPNPGPNGDWLYGVAAVSPSE